MQARQTKSSSGKNKKNKKKTSRKSPPAARPARGSSALTVPTGANAVTLRVNGSDVNLTNLNKVFWPGLGLTKRDLLQYYLDVSPWLLPHVQDRAMVLKRYPNGSSADFFFMKRAPESRPGYVEICSIEHHSGNVIDFVKVQDAASLLWTINLGCIDLNPWYARCDDIDRPDYLHFDLDPVGDTPFEAVRETALLVREALEALDIASYAKTTGSRGIHVYVPIVRGPVQKDVWRFAKAFAIALEMRHPELVTAEYRIANRPHGRVLVDYNQNAWNRTLASVYSVRPKPVAAVSTPVTWKEVERGIEIDDFTMQTVPKRLAKVGDLWKPLLAKRGRTNLADCL